MIALGGSLTTRRNRPLRIKLVATLVGLTALVAVSSTEWSTAAQTPYSALAYVRGGELTVRTKTGDTAVRLPQSVGDVALSPDGTLVAVTLGRTEPYGAGGVHGNVALIDWDTGQTLVTTGFTDALVTDVAFSPTGGLVAFVKDYRELWVLEIGSNEVNQMTRTASIAPLELGSAIFDPVFSPDGEEILFGLVERTFFGEDDKLDNLWSVSLAGKAQPVTTLPVPAGVDAWHILRSPQFAASKPFLISAVAGSDYWDVVAVTPEGGIRKVGPVPANTLLIGATQQATLFMTENPKTLLFNVVMHESSLETG